MKMDVNVPEVGESITSGFLAAWLKSDGDIVTEGEDLFELETEKTTLVVPSNGTGMLKILVQPETEVQIGQTVAEIDQDAEQQAPMPESPQKEEIAPQAEQTSETVNAGENVLSPAVKRVVAEHDLDASQLPATGPKGNITKEDALRAAEQQPQPQTMPQQQTPPPPPPALKQESENQTRVKMSRIRKKTAENLVLAQKTAAHLTTFNEIDMGAVMALRADYKQEFEKQSGVRLGFMSFFIKAAQQALAKYPEINAFIEDDEIVYNHTYNIGVAMSTEKGLLTPVVRAVEKKNFAEIEQAIVGFRDKALAKKLLPQELMGGTFTITNGGVFGSLLSTPIPNPPQSGILGMHTIQKRPVERNDEIVIRPMMYVALTYDHRIVDGREAIGFLIHIKRLLEDPNKLLLGI